MARAEDWRFVVVALAADGLTAAYAVVQDGAVRQTHMATLDAWLVVLEKMVDEIQSSRGGEDEQVEEFDNYQSEQSEDLDYYHNMQNEKINYKNNQLEDIGNYQNKQENEEFNHYQNNLDEQVHQKRWAFTVHGSGVVTVVLPNKCKEQDIELPSVLHNPVYFDLRSEVGRFLQRHQNLPPPTLSLPDIAYFFSTDIVQPLSSPLNQCLSIANIIIALLKYKYDDVLCIPVDTNQDLLQFEKEQSNVIHLSSLPSTITTSDVAAIFESIALHPVQLYMLRDTKGNPSGTGFAEMSTHEDAVAALKLTGYRINDTFIELTPSSPLVLEQANPFLSDFQASRPDVRQTVVRPGDWMCPDMTCNYHNFASRRYCYKCGTPISKPELSTAVFSPPHLPHMGTIKHEDWACPNSACSFHNYATRNQCLRCGHLRPSGMHTSSILQNMANYIPPFPYQTKSDIDNDTLQVQQQRQQRFTTGEWTCPNSRCRSQNAAMRGACIRCGSPPFMPPPSISHIKSNPPRFGESIVSSTSPSLDSHLDTSTLSFGSPSSTSLLLQSNNNLLRSPNNPNPIAITTPFRAGDWMCPMPTCMTHNFASRTSCLRCGINRPSNLISSSSYSDGFNNGNEGFSMNMPTSNLPLFSPNLHQQRSYSQHPMSNGGGYTPNFGNMHPFSNISSPGSQLLPGDWVCTQNGCNYHNFARRKQCAKCNSTQIG